MINSTIVQQHADDAAAMAANRELLTASVHVGLERLLSADERLRANLDALQLSGEEALPFYNALRETPSPGGLFVLTTLALEAKQQAVLDQLIALVQTVPETSIGLLSAFEWVERQQLKGTVATLLRDDDPFKRMIGVAACGMHGVDPGLVANNRLRDPDSGVRARAFRAAGELGVRELAADCALAATKDDDTQVRHWAAWSAVLLGERDRAARVLNEMGSAAGAHAKRSFRLTLQIMPAPLAHRTLQQLAQDAAQLRRLIEGSGIAGDAAYVPWLIRHMAEQKTARLAGEAFTLITGVNLGPAALDGPTPEGFESGPNDDPNDPDVDMDPDDGLSWPVAEKIEQWWAANGSRFQSGTRYFMGAPVTREHCLQVLKTGYQRQRILAAQYLCLLEPGTPLFNTSAPAWRQRRILSRM